MKYLALSAVLTIFALVCSLFFIGAGEKEEIDGKAYILMEAKTHTVIGQKNIDTHLNVGYLSKLMSILVIADDISNGKYNLTDEITASDNVTNTKGAVIWLESGDKLTVDELLKSIIVGNANDAMTVLAERSSGSVENFVMDMNAKAFDIGLRNSKFVSPYGYYSPDEYSTAYDVAVICSELTKYGFLEPYFRIWRDFVKNDSVELVNENTLSNSFSQHIGFKVCSSDVSRNCIAEGGKDEEGTVFISVVLGNEDKEEMFKYVKKELKMSFRDYKVIPSMFPDEMMAPLKVVNGTDPAVIIRAKIQKNAVVSNNTQGLRTRVIIPEYIAAPVRKGQAVGTASFYNEDTLAFETEIVAECDVSVLSLRYAFYRLLTKLTEK